MGSPNDLNAAEVAQIIEKSDMRDETLPYTYENGLLSASVNVGVNDVYFIRIVK